MDMLSHGMDWSVREGYAWAEDKEHCEEFGRMLTADVANLIYRASYTSTLKGGKPETLSVRSSSVYVRRDGKWWSVFYQETPIK